MRTYFQKKTYAPIRQLEQSLDSDSLDSNNSFKTISQSIEQLKRNSAVIEEQYKNSLSKIQNMYLINLLNTDNENISSEISSYFNFEYNYFCAVIYQIIPRDSLKNEYNLHSYEQLIQNFFTCIYEEYSSVFHTFTLPAEKNIFYIFLNVESTESISEINKIADTINSILTVDKELIDSHHSIGGVFEGLTGLKKISQYCIIQCR